MSAKRLQIVGVVLFAAVVAIPVFVDSRFILHMLTLIFFYIAMTSAWNIPVFGGKMSLGHAAFFGLGGYTGAILYVKFGVSPWIGAAAGVVVSLLGGVAGVTAALAMQAVDVSTTNFATFAELAFQFRMTPVIAVQSMLFALLMGFVGGFVPAWRAARLRIVDCLRAA